MISRRHGAWAAYASALLTVAALAVGITLGAKLAAASGAGVAAASPDSLRSVAPLLLAAELLKVASAAALALAVWAAYRVFGGRASVSAGLAAAAALLGAGLLAILAAGELGRPDGSGELARPVVLLGLACAVLTGIWAALLTSAAARRRIFPSWLRFAALTLLALGAGSLLVPPLALGFGLVSIAWWIGLARVL